jgi:hypothetical protein
MKGAAQFLLHWLIEDPKTGYLITNPSTSPENTMKVNGKEYQWQWQARWICRSFVNYLQQLLNLLIF